MLVGTVRRTVALRRNPRAAAAWAGAPRSLVRASSSAAPATSEPAGGATNGHDPAQPAADAAFDLEKARRTVAPGIGRPVAPPHQRVEGINGLPSREDQVARLASGEEFDVLVIGAGATGSGTALDAATRGLKVACVERGDFSCETSSRSTKLIWAGIRYIGTAVAALLQWSSLTNPLGAWRNFTGEFKMVLGAHRERRFLLETQPHLTRWVPIAVPMSRWFMWPAPMGHPIFSLAALTLPLVFKFYDSLSKFSCPPSYVMNKKLAYQMFPQMSQEIKYAQVFYEGQHNDARTAISIALTAAEKGAAIANYVEVTALPPDEDGKVRRAIARDVITGEEFEIKAKSIIMCGGPFTDSIRKLEDPDMAPAVRGAAGTHIVLPGYYCPNDMGLLDINTSDGRFLFFLPWLGSTIVGTTDRAGDADSDPQPPEEEIQWILNEVSKYLSPDLRVRRSDVLSAWQGWRPLAQDPHAPPGAPASRDHVISTNPKTGVTFITGGKWTTYREMAEQVLDRVVEEKGLEAGPCVTLKTPLIGADGYSDTLQIKMIQRYAVSEPVALHLAKTYGTRALDVCEETKPTGKRWPKFGRYIAEGYPYIESEVKYAVQEYARTVRDVLTLRTRLAFLNAEAARGSVRRIADLMALELGWSDEEKEAQIRDAKDYLKHFAGPVPDRRSVNVRELTPRDLRELFKSIDMDRSGYIDEYELGHAAELLGFPFESDEARSRAFKEIAGSEDGRVTFAEFEQWWNNSEDVKGLRETLSKRVMLSAEKLTDAGTGTMFG